MKPLRLALGAFGVLTACQPSPVVPTTFNFNRPADVAMVCLRVPVQSDGRIQTAPTPDRPEVPLPEALPPDDPACLAPESQRNVERPGFGIRLFALVTQSDRGEVAVVNLHSELNTGIVDNDRQVPGYTFIPVGAFPGALAVHPTGRTTYVANTGSNTVTVLDNTRLLSGGPHRVRIPGTNEFVQVTLPKPPADVAIGRNRDRILLFVTVPLDGTVRVFDVTDPYRQPTELPPITLMVPSGGIDGGMSVIDASVGEGGVAAVAHPDHIAVSDDGTVFVSDRSVPVIHVLRPDDRGVYLERDPLEAAVPTEQLAVSPAVPPEGRRYVYAVSAVDHTLMVFDADGAASRRPLAVNLIADRPECMSEAFVRQPERCPKIDPKLPFDRVPLEAPVRALTFVTRHGVSPDQGECAPVPELMACTVARMGQEPRPTVLRGVQAVVALRNGRIQVIDLYDPDRNCSGRATLPNQGDQQVMRAFQRHLPRSQGTSAQAPSVSGAPAFRVAGATVSESPELPRIVPIDGRESVTCNSANNFCIQLPTVPGTNIPDPLAVRDDTWTLTFEGVLPGLSLDTASFQRPPVPGDPPERVVLDAPGARFCERGALQGDRVVLSAAPPVVPEEGMDAGIPVASPCGDADLVQMCRDTFGTSSEPCNRELIVTAARESELELALPTYTVGGRVLAGDPRCSTPMEPAELRRRLRCCYPQATRFEVRAAGVWIVVGRRAGYLHNVVNREGRCVTLPADPGDATPNPPTGRVRENEVYRSPAFALRIQSGRAGTPRDATFQFSTTGGYVPLVLDGAPMPSALRYSCTNRRLYLVDQGRAALHELDVAPLDARRRLFN